MSEKLLNYLINLNRPGKQAIQIITDVFLVTLSFYLAFIIRLIEFSNIIDATYFIINSSTFLILLLLILFTISLLFIFGIYQTVIRFSGDRITILISITTLLSVIFLYICAHLFEAMIPRSVPIIYGLLSNLFLIVVRFSAKYLFFIKNTKKIKILIYGAGEAGRQVVNFMSKESKYEPVAFIDDNKKIQNFYISGLKVASPDLIGKILVRNKVEMVLLAIPSANRSRRKDIIEMLEKYSVEVRSMPSMADIVSGKSKINEIKNISFNELLGRETIPAIKHLISKNTLKKNVLVTGSGGSIGSELCKQIIKQNPKIILLLDSSEYALYKIYEKIKTYNDLNPDSIIPILGNIQDQKLLKEIIVKYKINTIYHAAAYKHVPLVEENIIESVKNNIVGTRNLLNTAINNEVNSFTMISTDKAVKPSNIMGATKKFAETLCKFYSIEQSKTNISIVRFGNVLGSSGSVIPLFSNQIEDGGPITVTHKNVKRYFMTIKEASELVIQASGMSRSGEIFILDMGEQVKILDVATRMARLQGYTPFIKNSDQTGDIEIVITGLRKGEKLREELHEGSETIPTEHPRIISVKENEENISSINIEYDELFKACEERDSDRIRKLLNLT